MPRDRPGLPQPSDADLDPAGPPPPLYVDLAALLAGGRPNPPRPTVLRRDDGVGLFYGSKVNVLFGDPESGKSWIALAAVAETLAAGQRATVLDVDHNGWLEVSIRLLDLGVPVAALSDPDLFRFYEPEDGLALLGAVRELVPWQPAAVVVDSIGEVIPLLGRSSNSPDDYATAHRQVLSALAGSDASVIAVDHLPKGEVARALGQTGTVAKKRAVNGASIRVDLVEPFTPGRGGSAALTIHKDRPGGPRAASPREGKQQPAGVFRLDPTPTGGLEWAITTGTDRSGASDGLGRVDLVELAGNAGPDGLTASAAAAAMYGPKPTKSQHAAAARALRKLESEGRLKSHVPGKPHPTTWRPQLREAG